MYVRARFPHSGRRLLVSLLFAVALFFNSVGTLFAGTTGNINGTITDAATKAPLAGVTVNAVSPTGRYTGKTNAQGFFSFTGVNPDTYTISFEQNGFQPASLTGVTVFADQTVNTSDALEKSLVTIGRVTARSAGSAFQPTQTQDTYTVTTTQIAQLLGKNNATSETNLLTRLPGATTDKYGYPVLRGGRETDEGFQFDGIDYVDAFTSQFTNNLALNPSLSQLQLTPGAGDASVGNAGTGQINLIAKRGTYPGFGTVDLEALLQPYNHQLALEYGFATPDGSISNYISFQGIDNGFQYGARGTAAQNLSNGIYTDNSSYRYRDIVDNFVYKFGRDKNQSIQLLYDNQNVEFLGTYGGNTNVFYPAGDPFALAGLTASGFTPAQIAKYLAFVPGQTSAIEPLDKGFEQQFQPNNVFKFQYTNNLNSSTFLSAKYYQLDATGNFDYPYEVGGGIGFIGSFDALQGGHRTGASIDISSQINSKNLVQIGGKFDFLHPVYNQVDPSNGFFSIGGFNNGFEAADFVSPTDPDCPLGADGAGKSYCGYLFSQLANPGKWPYVNEQTITNRQDFAVYFRDKFTPTDRLNIDVGLRVDGSHYQLPGLASGCNPTALQAYNSAQGNLTGGIPDNCLYYPSSFSNATVNGTQVSVPVTSVSKDALTPIIPEPRIAISYQLGKNDSVRGSFARSTEFAPLAFVDLYTPLADPALYNVPSYNVLQNVNNGLAAGTAAPAYYCGVTGNLLCTSYGDQVRWENQSWFGGVPIQPVKPETFTNYEFSYSHQFANNVSMKVTPFYRRGYDQLALVSSPRIGPNGGPIIDPNTGDIQLNPATSTNLGTNRTTGVEFYLTKEAAFGFSGQLSLTYLNEFSNVVPSPLIQEDFFPPIPTPSLVLGNQYRVGFVSPLSGAVALTYKFHNGFRINPVVTYSRGFPIGVGNVTAAYVGGVPYNIPSTNTQQAGAALGTNYAPNYVDPQNPGTLFKPNIAATRGTAETSSAAGVIANARFNTTLGLEYNHPGSRSTVGVLFTNLFNQLYGIPSYNSRYQPVATGISGPKTGTSTTTAAYPVGPGLVQYGPSQFGQDPYLLIPSQTPQTVRVYYQLAL